MDSKPTGLSFSFQFHWDIIDETIISQTLAEMFFCDCDGENLGVLADSPFSVPQTSPCDDKRTQQFPSFLTFFIVCDWFFFSQDFIGSKYF